MAFLEIQRELGTGIIFGDAGKSDEDVEISLTGLSDTTGRLSARYDLGAWPRARDVLVYGEFQCVATPTLGEILKIYAAWWATTAEAPGGIGNTDAAITADKLRNLLMLGASQCDAAAANTVFTFGPLIVPVRGRYLSLAVLNDFGADLTSDDEENFLVVWPFPPGIE